MLSGSATVVVEKANLAGLDAYSIFAALAAEAGVSLAEVQVDEHQRDLGEAYEFVLEFWQ